MKQPPKYGTHGKALRAFRDAAGIRQEDVCEIIGRGSYQWVGDLECGRRGLYELSPSDVDTLGRVTGVGTADLYWACRQAFAERHPWAADLFSAAALRRPAWQAMYDTAVEYYALLERVPAADPAELAVLKARLDVLSEPFSDDPAYAAFLATQRLVAEGGHSVFGDTRPATPARATPLADG